MIYKKKEKWTILVLIIPGIENGASATSSHVLWENTWKCPEKN